MSAIKRILAVVIALMIICAPASLAAPRYSTKDAELADFTVKQTYKGTVIYRVSASSALYMNGAIMEEILIESGQTVNAGDPIAAYTAPVSDVDITRAETAWSQAKDDHEYELERRQLVIDEYRTAAAEATDPDTARAYELKAERAEIELEQYRSQGDAHVASLAAERDAAVASSEIKYVTAPISGTVSYVRKIDQGTDMNGREIAGFFDPSSLIIRVANEGGLLKYGMKVDITLDGAGGRKNLKGTVVSADNALPGTLRSGTAYILPDEYAGDLQFNSAEVSAVVMSVPNVIVVPNSVLQYSNGKCFVRILDDDGTVRVRYVRIGMAGANESWVLYGIEPGDKLITK